MRLFIGLFSGSKCVSIPPQPQHPVHRRQTHLQPPGNLPLAQALFMERKYICSPALPLDLAVAAEVFNHVIGMGKYKF